jgi:ferritin-like metal-binding protein YciE
MAQTKTQTKNNNGTASKRAKAPGSSIKNSARLSKNSNSEDQSSLLQELFLDELKDIYWAEKHLLKALPKMAKASTSDELNKAFNDHLEVTKGHVARLEKVFELLDEKAQAKKCEAMAGLTKEGEGIIEDTEKGTLTRDVGLIMAAQKVEHYEIATYGSLAQLAKTLGKNDVADLMMQTLNEEKDADELLTGIAENNINVEATAE